MKWPGEMHDMSSSSFSSIIEKFFSRNGGWQRLKGEMAVYYWPRVAGKEMAKKVQAVRFRSGFLLLLTENPALAHQLLMMKADILHKYQQLLGLGIIKDIKVKVGSLQQSPESGEHHDLCFELNKEEAAAIEQCEREISDSVLAEKFASFMQRSFLKKKEIKANGGGNCYSCGVAVEAGFTYCPCCERKVHEEVAAYIQYKIKRNPRLTRNELENADGLRHLRH